MPSSSTPIELAVDLANGLPHFACACPGSQGSAPSSDLTHEQAQRLQQKLRADHDAFVRGVPTDWFEPELSHAFVAFGRNASKFAWSEVVYCRELLETAEREGRCLVYIFGTQERDLFTEVLAMRHPQCAIYAFDPTVAPERFVSAKIAEARARGNASSPIRFRPWGLRGGSRGWTHRYYARVVGELLTLDEIVTRLGHRNRRISLLRSDCEGCEYEWLSTAADASGSHSGVSVLHKIDQLFIELHFATTLRFDALALSQLPSVHEAITQHYCARVSFANVGGEVDRYRVPRLLVAAGADPMPCCRNYLLLNRRHAAPARPPSATAVALRMAADWVALPLAPNESRHGALNATKRVGNIGVARIEGAAHAWRRTYPFDTRLDGVL